MKSIIFALQFGAAFAICSDNPNKRVRGSEGVSSEAGGEKKPKIKVEVKTEIKEEGYKMDAEPKPVRQAPTVVSGRDGVPKPAVVAPQAAAAKPVGGQQQPIDLPRVPTCRPAEAAASAAAVTPFPRGCEVEFLTIPNSVLPKYQKSSKGTIIHSYVKIFSVNPKDALLFFETVHPTGLISKWLKLQDMVIKRGNIDSVSQQTRRIVFDCFHVPTQVDVSDLMSFHLARRLQNLESTRPLQQPEPSSRQPATFTPTAEWRQVVGDIPTEFEGKIELRHWQCKIEARLKPSVALVPEPTTLFPIGQEVDYVTISKDLAPKLTPDGISLGWRMGIVIPAGHSADKTQVKYYDPEDTKRKFVALDSSEILVKRGKIKEIAGDQRGVQFGPTFVMSIASVHQLSSFSRNAAEQILRRKVSDKPII